MPLQQGQGRASVAAGAPGSPTSSPPPIYAARRTGGGFDLIEVPQVAGPLLEAGPDPWASLEHQVGTKLFKSYTSDRAVTTTTLKLRIPACPA